MKNHCKKHTGTCTCTKPETHAHKSELDLREKTPIVGIATHVRDGEQIHVADNTRK